MLSITNVYGEEPAISVQIEGDSTFYLDSPNKIIRASVEIQNYTPSDGIYFMKVTHLPTQKVMKDFDIYPRQSGNDLWSVQIAYPFLEADITVGNQILFGEYQIHIRTEFGSQTASTTFSILESQDESEPISEIPTPSSSRMTLVKIPQGTSVPSCETTNECYIPYEVTVDVGDVVMWSNNDSAAHTVTGGLPADGPSGVFDSSLILGGAQYAFTFEEAGSYDYFCMVHPWMVGNVVVETTTLRDDDKVTETSPIIKPTPEPEPEPAPTPEPEPDPEPNESIPVKPEPKTDSKPTLELVPTPTTSTSNEPKQGLWIKFGFNVEVQTGDRIFPPKPENNDQDIEDFLMFTILSSIIPAEVLNYDDPKNISFITLEYSQISDEVVVINHYVTTKDGKEFFVSKNTIDTEKHLIDVENREIGEIIKVGDESYPEILDFKKQQFGGKEVDVVVIGEEKISSMGTFKLQSEVHKQTGIILSVQGEITGNIFYPDDSLSFDITAVEISDEFVQKSNSLGGGCLIATATYGSELAPQVQQLRELRDNKLLQTQSGSAFMESFNDFYYSFSPIIADYERENPLFKEVVKLGITPMISSLSILNHVDMDSEADVIGYGISLILLNVGMYIGIPAIVVIGIRKH